MSDSRTGRLAPALVKKVFSIYFVLAVLLTLVQIGLDYRETYKQVLSELDATVQAFEPGIADAVWNYQGPLVQSIARGLVDGKLILAVHIRDKSGHLQIDQTHGVLTGTLLDVSRRIELMHTDREGAQEAIGEMTVYSNQSVVLGRVQYGLLLTVVTSVLKTLGLWLIMVAVTHRLVARPLKALTEQIGAFDVAHAEQPPNVDLGPSRSAELCVLRDAFNDLAGRVVTRRSELSDLAATLERHVQARTAELIEKNRALSNEVLVRQAAEQALRRERDFSLALVRAIPELFVLVDEKGSVVMSNPNAKRTFALLDGDQRRVSVFATTRDRDTMNALLAEVFEKGEASCEADLMLAGGRIAPYYLIAHRVQIDDHRCAIIVAVDISVRRAAEKQMRYMALYDALTELPNRTMLHDRLAQAITVATRSEQCMAVLFVDLDGFKAINDNAGHDVGDNVLREVGHRLRHSIRASDTAARYGGDEFVIVLSCVANVEAAAVMAQKLIETLSVPIECDGEFYKIGASIGISVLPDHGSHAAALLERADAAMYRAKRRGKSCYEFADLMSSG